MSRQDFQSQYSLYRKKQATNTSMLTQSHYDAILSDLLDMRRNGGPFVRRHYPIFRAYDVMSSGNVHKIVRKKTRKEVVHEGSSSMSSTLFISVRGTAEEIRCMCSRGKDLQTFHAVQSKYISIHAAHARKRGLGQEHLSSPTPLSKMTWRSALRSI